MTHLLNTLFTAIGVSLLTSVHTQIAFNDNFENYNKDAYIAASNNKWTTWSASPGTQQDPKISLEQSKSGKQSVKFSSTLPSGGPAYLVLPLQTKYTSGQFTFRVSIFIPKNKSGYFDVQSNSSLGQNIALQVNFNQGIIRFFNSKSNYITSTFDQDKWIDILIDVNLSNNIWSVHLNSKCIGAFTNSVNSISAISFYPYNSSSLFYMDDVAYTYSSSSSDIKNDGSLSDLVWNFGKLIGNKGKPKINFRNSGTSRIQDVDFFIKVNNNTSTFRANNLNLEKGKSIILDLPEIFLNSGGCIIEVTIQKLNGLVNDEISCNNTVSIYFNTVKAAPYKAVLVEEGTGPWCQWCPRGAVYMDRFNKLYPDMFIPIAVHNGSTNPMKVPEYDSFLAFSGFPAVRVNRNSQPIDPSAVESPFLNEIAKPTVVSILPHAKFNPLTRLLEITTEVQFLESASGEFQLTLVLTEDGVTGTTAAYNQVNAYAGGFKGEMGGYEFLPNPVPASKMVYNHVSRAVNGLRPEAGNTNTGSFQKGQKVNFKSSFTLSETWNQGNMHIIPILLEKGKYVNAAKVSVKKALETSIVSKTEETDSEKLNVKIYPNPASDITQVSLNLIHSSEVSIEIIDSSGRLISKQNYGTHVGKINLPIYINNLGTGVYLIRIITSVGSCIKKITVI